MSIRWMCVVGLLAICSGQATAELERSTVTVLTNAGKHSFDVEIADEPEERRIGMMHRESMDENGGMLFNFRSVEMRSMWMKNTLIPLDMLFVDHNGTIISIAHRAVPGSRRQISSGSPALAVLEISGGRARELGIKPGDTLVHEIFDNGA